MKLFLIISVIVLVIIFAIVAKIDMKIYKQYEESRRRLLIGNTVTYKEYISRYRPNHRHNHPIMGFLFVGIIVLLFYLIS